MTGIDVSAGAPFYQPTKLPKEELPKLTRRHIDLLRTLIRHWEIVFVHSQDTGHRISECEGDLRLMEEALEILGGIEG